MLGCVGMVCITAVGLVIVTTLHINGQILAATATAIGAIIGVILGRKTS